MAADSQSELPLHFSPDASMIVGVNDTLTVYNHGIVAFHSSLKFSHKYQAVARLAPS